MPNNVIYITPGDYERIANNPDGVIFEAQGEDHIQMRVTGTGVYNTLYYIQNCGCDDTTRGLVKVPDIWFPSFKRFIEDLNKNSTYGCMPTIEVYRIPKNSIRKAKDDECEENPLYMNDTKYVLKKPIYQIKGAERII